MAEEKEQHQPTPRRRRRRRGGRRLCHDSRSKNSYHLQLTS